MHIAHLIKAKLKRKDLEVWSM